MPKSHDIAVLGATAAGYAAAIAAARRGCRVVVADCPASSRTESPLGDWIPADLLGIWPPVKSLRAALDAPFRAMRFHSEELERQSSYRGRSILGFLLHSRTLLSAMEKLARKCGVEVVRLKEPPVLRLEESGAVLAGKRDVRGSLLLLAQGQPAEAAAELALPLRPPRSALMTLCGLDVPVPARGPDGLDGDLHVVAFAGGRRLGMFFAAGGAVHVRLIAAADETARAAESDSHQADQLGGFIARLQRAQLLPERLDLAKAAAAIWHPPGGAALELESLLAKRTLLIGTAGGFASAMTGQTLDPSIRSAVVAADVAAKALKSQHLQEVLGDYKVQWRGVLADRLRPPGTSLQMLLPMVLANQAITGKFARAFLYGENL